jgi:hypothetical protein
VRTSQALAGAPKRPPNASSTPAPSSFAPAQRPTISHCTPNYFIDDRGIKHLKPECL